MEEDGSSSVTEVAPSSAATETQTDGGIPDVMTTDTIVIDKSDNVSVSVPNESTDNKESYVCNKEDSVVNNDESGIVLDTTSTVEVSPTPAEKDDTCDRVCEPCEVNDDARSLGDLESLPAGDELALGAAGSDSGVEGCGRALSSGGGSRSCASSVVSCGSGCGSESSSLAGAPPRPRRRVSVNVAEPKRNSPVGSSTPRPVTAPRGPNLATRERARSREKPTLPEKPRPLTPKPRIRPTSELPNLVRESPALRAKPTKTSSARCRTPNSPCEEKRWPSNGPRLATVADATATRVAADKYGTLPRKRRDGAELESSPKHESTPARRPTVARSSSSRSAVRTRVRIYAEKTTQTVLLGTDVESALGGVLPNIETSEVTRCHRGVQACGREAEAARVAAAVAAAAHERARREHAEAALAEERAARHAALADLERNSQRLLELAGAAGAGAGAGAEGCLRALEEQLRSASEQAAKHRAEIDMLRDKCNKLHNEACSERARARLAEARLAEAEREAAEMQDFLAAETGALAHSLRDKEAEAAALHADLDKRRSECRQLVRLCEQRRQEALGAAARARGGAGAARALDALQRRLAAVTRAVERAYGLPPDPPEPTVYYNDAYSRSDSGEALSPPPSPERGGLLGALSRALRSAPAPAPAPPADEDRSHGSEDNDYSADLLDSETEPCLVTDPEYAEEWWSGAENAGAWSGDELSPERDSGPDGDKEGESCESLRTLSAAIAQRWEAEGGRGSLVRRVATIDARLTALLSALTRAAAAASAHGDGGGVRLAHALRDKIDVTEKNVAEVVVKKLAELDASKNMMEQYRQSVETRKKQLAQDGEEDDLEYLEEEVSSWSESERRARYAALDAALGALGAAPRHWARLAPLAAALERLAFALAATPPAPPAPLATPA